MELAPNPLLGTANPTPVHEGREMGKERGEILRQKCGLDRQSEYGV